MIIAFVLCLIDFIVAAYLQSWVMYSLLAYFLVLLSIPRPAMRDTLGSLLISLVLLVAQDFYFYDRCGLILVYLIPLILVAHIINRIVISPALLLPFLTSYFFLIESFMIKNYLFLQSIPIDVTIQKILINIVVGYLVLWGVRGNRSFSSKIGKGRKVWTLNRKDAL